MVVGVISILFCLLWKLRYHGSIVNVLTTRYGRQTLSAYRSLEKFHRLSIKIGLDITFLQTCYDYDTIPKFMYFKVYTKNFRNSDLYRDWQFTLLEREIRQQQRKREFIIEKLEVCRKSFKNLVSFLDYWTFIHKIFVHNKVVSEKVKLRHERKLRSLGINRVNHNEDCIFNISNKVLTVREKKLLMLGLDFCIPFYKCDWLKHHLAVERLYNTILDVGKLGLLKHGIMSDSLGNRIKEISYNNFKLARRQWDKLHCLVFKKEDINVLKELGADDSIVIVRPDKGKGVVIMDKTDYVGKMGRILSDKTKFKEIKGDMFDIIVKLEDKLNRMLRSIKDKIGSITFNNLYASGSVPGIMYGLPKVHKVGIPLRPIVSSIKTAGYNLARFLQPLVTPLTTNQFTVLNSSNFVKEVLTLELPREYILTSYDVESLFTNVPLDETLDIILEDYKPSEFFDIRKDLVRKLFKFATSESCFIFNNKLYSQIDGVTMGSSLGPIFANAFLCNREEKWLDDCPIEFKPIYYRRYVDDTFLIFKCEDDNRRFFQYINSRHRNIKFTYEKERNGSLSFLDILITKTSTGLVTGVYRKPTYTGLGLSWFSFCPRIYKINSVKTLLNRAYDICSNYFTFHEEICTLKSYFKNNNYTVDLFENILKKFLNNKQLQVVINKCDVPKLVKYVRLPFYGKISYNYRKLVLNILRNSCPSVNFRIVFTNSFRIGTFFNFKDRVPDPLCSDIVYKFTCPSCQARYVGCSGRAFRIRVLEHIGKSYRSGKFLHKMPFSAVRNHSLENDHPFAVKDFTIIGRFRTHSDAMLGEKLLIKKLRPDINFVNNT